MSLLPGERIIAARELRVGMAVARRQRVATNFPWWEPIGGEVTAIDKKGDPASYRVLLKSENGDAPRWFACWEFTALIVRE